MDRIQLHLGCRTLALQYVAVDNDIWGNVFLILRYRKRKCNLSAALSSVEWEPKLSLVFGRVWLFLRISTGLTSVLFAKGIVRDDKHGLYFFFSISLLSHPFAMWVCNAFHQGMESSSPPRECGLSFGFGQQYAGKWDYVSSKARYQDTVGASALPLGNASPPCEPAWASCWMMSNPWLIHLVTTAGIQPPDTWAHPRLASWPQLHDGAQLHQSLQNDLAEW